MPYPNAHLYVLALIPASILGFWPAYFSDVAAGSAAFHIHAISSTAWIVLLAAQSWSIHNKQRQWHRQMGVLSLFLFPIFLMGFFIVFQTESQKALLGEDPFKAAIGPSIGSITAIAIVATGYLYYCGLKYRSNVQLHARYLLAIPFLFTESVLGRILNSYTPGFRVTSLEEVHLIYWAFHLSEFLAIALAMYLYWLAPRFGRPFVVVSIVMVLQSIAIETLDQFSWWRELFFAIADVPVLVTAITGLGVGALVAWLGWIAPIDRPVSGALNQP